MKYLHEESGVTYGSLREFRRVSGIAFPADPTGGHTRNAGAQAIESDPGEALEEARRRALEKLHRVFLDFRANRAKMKSALGFVVDATERAIIDVSGLVAITEGSPEAVPFMDAANKPHPLTHEQLVALQKEIVLNGSRVYERKWALRNAILKASSVEELDRVVVSFE